MGANPVNDAIKFVGEYLPVAGSIFCAEPVFPAAVHPSSRARCPVPFSTTPSISPRIVAAVSGRITLLGSVGVRTPVIGNNCAPRRNSFTTCGLTKREIDCLRLIARGITDREVGKKLGISTSTAHEHFETAKKKLKASTRAEATAIAVSLAIVAP